MSDSQTESGSDREPPRPGSRDEQRAWAIRQYLGIGEDGEPVEELTAGEIAARLGVSDRTVRRWCNEEPLPLVAEWGTRERLTLYACVVAGDRDAVEEYIAVQQLLARAGERGNRLTSHWDDDNEEESTFEAPFPEEVS